MNVIDIAEQRFPGYREDRYNVLARTRLDTSIGLLLATLPREEWNRHANYAGMVEHLQGIHRGILEHGAALAQALTALAEGKVGATQAPSLNRQLREGMKQYAEHLHAHHRIEDHQLFPGILQSYRRIERPLALLEADHRVLNAAVESFERVLRDYPADDAQVSAYDRLAQAAALTERAARRHIHDEEAIVVPPLLGMGPAAAAA
ncbi:hemerythrin domain-containing protein [Burkholderia cenocepacia]|uniref:hemerythrin domain-containing protein n=1 Tax=Burkholderia cenocepacia TaxID=95486 RepID=UPI000847885B|nr:hemerythrin domain-containing protein [Burkholderia cenocepacia]